MSFDWTKPRKPQRMPLVDKVHLTVTGVALVLTFVLFVPHYPEYQWHVEERLTEEGFRWPRIILARWGFLAWYMCSPLSMEFVVEAYDMAGSYTRFIVCDYFGERTFYRIR